jgi:UDP-galactopyranose mutase
MKTTHIASGRAPAAPDLICFSHLRWDFVYQRPQHLLTRAARDRRVFFMEEPLFDTETARVDVSRRQDTLWVVTPHLPPGTDASTSTLYLRELLYAIIATHEIKEYVLWFYTPMAVDIAEGLSPLGVIYDCMDELSGFKGAPPELGVNEARLFKRADVVFTGGQSLFEAKRSLHQNIHAFPSSIDAEHFRTARNSPLEPADQALIPGPKIGFSGVIDERMDVELITALASSHPEWHFVLIGPVVKIDPQSLPRLENVHYLGAKSYADLPAYISGWDVALIPFVLNESTRFISPTKTPEYLAAGKRVVSTPIQDVVSPYGDRGLVSIARDQRDFADAIAISLAANRSVGREQWLDEVDAFLARSSWDSTWREMSTLIDAATTRAPARSSYVPVPSMTVAV